MGWAGENKNKKKLRGLTQRVGRAKGIDHPMIMLIRAKKDTIAKITEPVMKSPCPM